jgi:hypothetical protein
MSDNHNTIDREQALRFAIRYFEREMPDADMAQIEEAARLFLAELANT